MSDLDCALATQTDVAGARYSAHLARTKGCADLVPGRILLVSFTVAGGSLTDPLPGNYRFVSVVALSSTVSGCT